MTVDIAYPVTPISTTPTDDVDNVLIQATPPKQTKTITTAETLFFITFVFEVNVGIYNSDVNRFVPHISQFAIKQINRMPFPDFL